MQLKITSNVPVPKFDNDEKEGSNNNIGEEPPIEHKDTIVEEYETDKGYRNLINGASVTGDSSGMGTGKPKKAKKSKAKKENQPAQDMGSSWIQTELSTTCNDMVFLSEKIGVLVGRNLTSYVTEDGGETWTNADEVNY